MRTVADVLAQAQALIDTPDKWCQGKARSRDGRVMRRCSLAAVNTVARSAPRLRHAATELLNQHALRLHGKPEPYSFNPPVVQLNDADGTTHADVMNLFEQARAAAAE